MFALLAGGGCSQPGPCQRRLRHRVWALLLVAAAVSLVSSVVSRNTGDAGDSQSSSRESARNRRSCAHSVVFLFSESQQAPAPASAADLQSLRRLFAHLGVFMAEAATD